MPVVSIDVDDAPAEARQDLSRPTTGIGRLDDAPRSAVPVSRRRGRNARANSCGSISDALRRQQRTHRISGTLGAG